MGACPDVQDIVQLWYLLKLMFGLSVSKSELPTCVRSCRQDLSNQVHSQGVTLATSDLHDLVLSQALNSHRLHHNFVPEPNTELTLTSFTAGVDLALLRIKEERVFRACRNFVNNDAILLAAKCDLVRSQDDLSIACPSLAFAVVTPGVDVS